jgi:exodeoxyribonuclease VII small subunit
MAKKNKSADLAEQPLESLIARLEEIVQAIDSGDVSLEASITLYEEGRSIAAQCAERLQHAEQKLTRLNPALLQSDTPDDAKSEDDSLF